MIRMPPYLDDFTGTYARTTHGRRACTATESIAIHKYKPPFHRRFFYGLCRWGWAIVPAVLALSVLTGCADSSAEISQAQELEAAQQDAEALASREFAGQQVCGPAALATWQDDKTLVCTPKRGQPYRVAASP